MKLLEGQTVGIDLGTTYSAIAQLDNDGNPTLLDNTDERSITPSVVLLGDQGAVVSDGRAAELIEPFVIDPVDTTASGDAFAAAIAVCWTARTTLAEAVRFACAAGAISATRLGAQPGLPTLAEVKQLANNSKLWADL